MKQLEEIAGSFKGVQKTFAIQAGREIRIIVDSEKISDEESIGVARHRAPAQPSSPIPDRSRSR